MKFHDRFREVKGFSLVEVMIALGVLGISIVTMAQVLPYLSRMQTTIDEKSNMTLVRENVLVYLLQDDAWKLTSQDAANTTFSCLLDGTTCPAKGGPFRVLDSQGTVAFDLRSPTSGFTSTGQACSTFPSQTCVFQLKLSWSPVCTTCTPAQIDVQGEVVLSSRDPASSSINGQKRGFHLIRNFDTWRDIHITADTKKYVLRDDPRLAPAGGTKRVRVTIDPGVTVYSDTSAVPAFSTGAPWGAGSQIVIINKGKILGAGGNGGDAPRYVDNSFNPGAKGGVAVLLQYSASIDNQGKIWGGGGGGTGSRAWWDHGGGGGGGAGYTPGAGGAASIGTHSASSDGGINTVGQGPGQPGTSTSGGKGGKAVACGGNGCAVVCAGDGGDAGETGWIGASGGQCPGCNSCSTRLSRSGGAPGEAVKTGANTLTWISGGDTKGPIVP